MCRLHIFSGNLYSYTKLTRRVSESIRTCCRVMALRAVEAKGSFTNGSIASSSSIEDIVRFVLLALTAWWLCDDVAVHDAMCGGGAVLVFKRDVMRRNFKVVVFFKRNLIIILTSIIKNNFILFILLNILLTYSN